MASNRTVYHVIRNAWADKWVVSREPGDLTEEFYTKGEAEYFARQRARKQQPSQVTVHDADGKVDYESTYGDDPPGSSD